MQERKMDEAVQCEDNDDEILKPCPCGDIAYFAIDDDNAAIVYCTCGMNTGWQDTLEDAAHIWNNRKE